jgi:hypothetical protein
MVRREFRIKKPTKISIRYIEGCQPPLAWGAAPHSASRGQGLVRRTLFIENVCNQR